jgi:predicted nucleotidyltransferase
LRQTQDVSLNLSLFPEKTSKKFAFLLTYSYLCPQMKKNVQDSIRKLLAQILPPNATARLYGSQARGDAHRGSDWDILIVMDKDKLLPMTMIR